MRNPPATDAERLILEAEDQQNQLLLAVKRRDTANLRTLLQLGVNVNTVDADGVPAIAWAAFAGDVETVKALLAAGADVRNQNAPGHLALLIYLAEGLPRVIQTGKRDAAARTRSETTSHDEVVMRLIKARGRCQFPELSPRHSVERSDSSDTKFSLRQVDQCTDCGRSECQ